MSSAEATAPVELRFGFLAACFSPIHFDFGVIEPLHERAKVDEGASRGHGPWLGAPRFCPPHHGDPQAHLRTHADRMKNLCNDLGIPFDEPTIERAVRLRNELLHEARWDGAPRAGSTPLLVRKQGLFF